MSGVDLTRIVPGGRLAMSTLLLVEVEMEIVFGCNISVELESIVGGAGTTAGFRTFLLNVKRRLGWKANNACSSCDLRVVTLLVACLNSYWGKKKDALERSSCKLSISIAWLSRSDLEAEKEAEVVS